MNLDYEMLIPSCKVLVDFKLHYVVFPILAVLLVLFSPIIAMYVGFIILDVFGEAYSLLRPWKYNKRR